MQLTETEGQIDRLEKVFAVIEKKPQAKTCAAINGITEEGAEIMEEEKGHQLWTLAFSPLRRPSNIMRFLVMEL